MPYIEAVIAAGKVKEVTKYHTLRYNSPKRPRNKNKNKTTQQQNLNNERRARKKLFWLINANFKEDDLYLTLTYDKQNKEPGTDIAKVNLRKFIRKLRDQYKSQGVALKYIAITEHQKRRIHHHILINAIGLGITHIKQLWKFGFIKVQLFAGEPEDCDRLANYFIKESSNVFNTNESVHGLRWISSKNLIHPAPDKRVVSASSWREPPKPHKGYYIDQDSVKTGETSSGYRYLFYRMIKIPESEEGGLSNGHKRKNSKTDGRTNKKTGPITRMEARAVR